MPKAYLEPNVINWARRADWSGADLRGRLDGRGLEPHVGIHGIYELARGFLSEEAKSEAQRNFQILSQLEPVFGPTPEMLYAKALDRLRTGAHSDDVDQSFRSDADQIRSERSDAGLSQCETVIDIRQGVCQCFPS